MYMIFLEKKRFSSKPLWFSFPEGPDAVKQKNVFIQINNLLRSPKAEICPVSGTLCPHTNKFSFRLSDLQIPLYQQIEKNKSFNSYTL